MICNFSICVRTQSDLVIKESLPSLKFGILINSSLCLCHKAIPASVKQIVLGVVSVLMYTNPKYCGIAATNVLIDCCATFLPSSVAPHFFKLTPKLFCF